MTRAVVATPTTTPTATPTTTPTAEENPEPMPTRTLTPPRPLRAIVPVLAAVLFAACAQTPDEEPGASPTDGATTPPGESTAEPTAPTSPSPPDSDDDGDGEVGAMAFTECGADRYTVGHPQDWTTNDVTDVLGPCEIFHPGDIEEPQRPRGMDLHYAVAMYVDTVDYDDRDPDDNPNEILERRETSVDGHSARLVEYRSTGQALTPEGERSYTWEVDLGGATLVATTSSVGETDYERDKRVLDRMVTEELTISDVEMVDGPSTTERSTQEPDGSVVLTDVDIGAHGSFDRLVFEFTGEGEAGWLIEYDQDPRSQGRGDPVDIEGAAVLRVALRHIPYPGDAPVEGYDGPQRIEPERTEAIVEVVEDVLYEGYQDFFVGLDEQRPYRVERLSAPQRVVIDLETG